MNEASSLRRSLVTLGAAELLSWGVLYYSFPVAATHIAADRGWSATTLAGIYSLCLVTAAVSGLILGKGLSILIP